MRLCKIKIAGLLILGVLGMFTGCRHKEPGRYYNQEAGFSIVFPSDWKLQEKFMGTTVLGLRPAVQGDVFAENVNVVEEALSDEIQTLDVYVARATPFLEKMLTDFKSGPSASAMLSGEEARRLEYTHRMGGKLPLKVLAYVGIKKRKAYIVTCTAVPEKFNTYLPVFEQIVQSFRYE